MGASRSSAQRPWSTYAARWYPALTALAFGALLFVALGALLPPAGSGGPARLPVGAAAQEVPPGAGARPVEVVATGDGFRVIRHAAGTTRVPLTPQRICALTGADELLAIGVRPAAHAISDGLFPDYLATELAGVPWIPNVYGGQMPNLEAIVAIRPDLIISRSRSLQSYHQLSKIAPVVVLLDQMTEYRQRMLDVGVIVGRPQQAQRRVAWYDAKVAAAKTILHDRLGEQTMAVLRIRPKTYRLYGDERGGSHVDPVLYDDLAIRRPRLAHSRTWSATKSPEDLLHLDADHLILSADAAPGSTRTLQDLLVHPVWQRVPAVCHHRVLIITKHRHWADAGILGRARSIDDVLRAVAPESLAGVDAHARAVLDAP